MHSVTSYTFYGLLSEWLFRSGVPYCLGKDKWQTEDLGEDDNIIYISVKFAKSRAFRAFAP